MSSKKTRGQEEYEVYADPKNLEPQGPPVRRGTRFTELVPVRFTQDALDAVRRLADEEDRSVSSWIRRAVDAALTANKSSRSQKTG